MSDALYVSRLRWDGRSGCAKFMETVQRLSRPPDLAISYVEIDYRPPVASIIRPYPWSEPRDMNPAEVAACAMYLRGLRSDLP